MDVGDRIKVMRNELEMNQSDFAASVGITQGGLSKIESGHSRLALDTLNSIAYAHEVDLNWLVTGRGDSSLPALWLSMLGEGEHRCFRVDTDQAKENCVLCTLQQEVADMHVGKLYVLLTQQEVLCGHFKEVDEEQLILEDTSSATFAVPLLDVKELWQARILLTGL